MSPVCAVLAGRIDGDDIIKGLTRRDATGNHTGWVTNTRRQTINVPLRDVGGSVHPAGRVEEHAMMVEGGWLVERVGHMEKERVGRADRDWGRSVECLG